MPHYGYMYHLTNPQSRKKDLLDLIAGTRFRPLIYPVSDKYWGRYRAQKVFAKKDIDDFTGFLHTMGDPDTEIYVQGGKRSMINGGLYDDGTIDMSGSYLALYLDNRDKKGIEQIKNIQFIKLAYLHETGHRQKMFKVPGGLEKIIRHRDYLFYSFLNEYIADLNAFNSLNIPHDERESLFIEKYEKLMPNLTKGKLHEKLLAMMFPEQKDRFSWKGRKRGNHPSVQNRADAIKKGVFDYELIKATAEKIYGKDSRKSEVMSRTAYEIYVNEKEKNSMGKTVYSYRNEIAENMDVKDKSLDIPVIRVKDIFSKKPDVVVDPVDGMTTIDQIRLYAYADRMPDNETVSKGISSFVAASRKRHQDEIASYTEQISDNGSGLKAVCSDICVHYDALTHMDKSRYPEYGVLKSGGSYVYITKNGLMGEEKAKDQGAQMMKDDQDYKGRHDKNVIIHEIGLQKDVLRNFPGDHDMHNRYVTMQNVANSAGYGLSFDQDKGCVFVDNSSKRMIPVDIDPHSGSFLNDAYRALSERGRKDNEIKRLSVFFETELAYGFEKHQRGEDYTRDDFTKERLEGIQKNLKAVYGFSADGHRNLSDRAVKDAVFGLAALYPADEKRLAASIDEKDGKEKIKTMLSLCETYHKDIEIRNERNRDRQVQKMSHKDLDTLTK